MKKLFLLIAVVAMILPSCKKINETLESLDNRVTELENTTIPTINEQIAKINTSIADLGEADVELKNYITALQGTAAELQKSIDATNIKIDEIKVTLQSEISTAKAEVLAQLEALRTEMNNELAQISSTIAILQAKDVEIEQKIADLNSYVDNELKNTEDWATATFSTLEQYNAVCAEIATIKTQIENLNKSISELETRLNTKIATDIASAVKGLQSELADVVTEITNSYTSAISTAKEEITAAYTVAIQSAISALESSMKQWVGEQLANYYTIAQVDAKISTLQRQIQANGTEELINEINTLKSSLQSMKSELTTAYQKAITDAINTNNGVINNKIANEIASVNQRITNEIKTFNSRLDDIESRLDALEDKVDDLMNRKLEITFEDTEDIAILAGSSCKVNYTVTSSESEIHIATIAQNGWKASVTKSTEKTGYITVYAPNPLTTEPIIVLVSDANTTIMRSLTFVNGVTNIATKSYAITNKATTLSVNVSTNLNYTVSIPSTASSWISLKNITTRATVRNDVINLNIKENTSTSSRKATLQLVCDNVEVGTISIYQQGIEVANNELVYTSSDGKIIEPYQTMGFNANIISNTYSNGRGVIVFDKAITAISEYAFYNCTKLTSIKMPKSVTKIKDYAFYNTAILEIDIPANVTEVADYAFYSTNITNLLIPNTLISIGEYAFSYNPISKLDLGDSITKIGNNAFSSIDIKNLIIPDNVTLIGDNAFSNCEKLTSCSIGKGVTTIGKNAFYTCASLTSVYCKPTTPPSIYMLYNYSNYSSNNSGSFPFNNMMKIYVPRNSYDGYMQYTTCSNGYIDQQNWHIYEDYIVAYDF
ncbi:MAG: leucine-rich repeat protein [Alistipes sp.]|nr:leucine-rich repeat protein [Alistipes sp.]